MDFPKQDNPRGKKIRRIAFGRLSVLALGGTSLGLAHLRPAAPTVERASIYSDTVKRGEMVREVYGLGTLVPVDMAPEENAS